MGEEREAPEREGAETPVAGVRGAVPRAGGHMAEGVTVWSLVPSRGENRGTGPLVWELVGAEASDAKDIVTHRWRV